MTQESKAGPIYLIDGSSYLYRAFFAIRGLTNHEGLPTNAIFGFANMVFKILNERHPSHMAVVFDAKGPTFRHDRYPEYKAHRPPAPEDLVAQIPYVKRLLEGMHIPTLEIEGVEADDVIGTLSRMASEEGRPSVIVSSDKDFFQLLSDDVSMWDTMKDIRLTPAEIKNRFGVEPGRVIEVQALMGDSSDNIPGVSGVGEKTAVKLIGQYGDLETLLSKVGEIKQPKLRQSLTDDADKARLARELMAIRMDVEVPFAVEDLKLGDPDTEALTELFTELDFQRFLEQIEKEKRIEQAYDVITGESQLQALVDELKAYEIISLDLETTSTDPMLARIVGMSLSGVPHKAAYIPVAHTSPLKQLTVEKTLEILRPLLESESPSKVGQNIKYDYVILQRYGVTVKSIVFDTMVGSYLINPDRYAHNLENMAREFLGQRLISYKDLVGKGKEADTFEELPIEKAAAYGGQDADVTLRLYAILKDALAERNLTSLMNDVEVPLIFVLSRMEQWGVKIDTDLLNDMSKEFEGRLYELERDIYREADEEFNINSPKQLGQILFEQMGLPTHKKTKKKTGYSTDMEVMTILARDYPIAEYILNYRTLSKLKGTYIDALPKLVNPETGRVHTSYNQTVAATGRLSSSDPNLQNIPIRGEEGRKIRKAFIPEPGWKLISADYSQIELRVLAHYSRDKTLTKAFMEGEDVHARTASEVFGVVPELMDPELRRRAKVINFGIIYGMSSFGLARELGIGRKEADNYIKNYFARLPDVQRYIKENLLRARADGFVTTLLGRRRYLPQIKSKNHAMRSLAERIATNAPIQGSAADIIKLAMIRIMEEIDERKLETKMIMQVHDELVLEAPEKEVDEAREIIRNCMEKCIRLTVPLTVDMNMGSSWAEAH
jgi:DNA polymerase I